MLTLRPSFSLMPSIRPSESTVTIALEEFYGCTSGNEWIDKSNWLKFTVSWCDWYGVTCIENSKLIEDIA